MVKAEKAELKKAEAEYKKNTNALATAKQNNKFLERVDELEEERAGLEEQKAEWKEFADTVELEKTATRKLNPAYEAWRGKLSELNETNETIDTRKGELKNAEKDASNAAEVIKKAETDKKKAETLQKKAAFLLPVLYGEMGESLGREGLR